MARHPRGLPAATAPTLFDVATLLESARISLDVVAGAVDVPAEHRSTVTDARDDVERAAEMLAEVVGRSAGPRRDPRAVRGRS